MRSMILVSRHNKWPRIEKWVLKGSTKKPLCFTFLDISPVLVLLEYRRNNLLRTLKLKG